MRLHCAVTEALVIYAEKVSEPKVRTGDILGDLTNELQYSINAYIEEFVPGGPKNYAFSVYSATTAKRSVKCKVKSITLNYTHSQTISAQCTVQSERHSIHRGYFRF